MRTIDTDIVIGGGGVAGAVTAIALQQLGYEVLVVEPGLNHDRRLAGELLHPPGVAGLAELGVLNSLMGEPAVAINGFCISSGPDEACIRLPYDASPSHHAPGFSLDHGLIRQRLMQAARMLPRVTVVDDARVVGVDQNEREVIVQVAEHKVTPQELLALSASDDEAAPVEEQTPA